MCLTDGIKVFFRNWSFTLAAQPGWSSNGWILPKVSYQYMLMSILLRIMDECMSIRRYSAAGL